MIIVMNGCVLVVVVVQGGCMDSLPGMKVGVVVIV